MARLATADACTVETVHSLERVNDQLPERYLLEFEGGASRIHTLPERGEIVCGRSKLCAIRVNDIKASREHAKFTVSPESLFVEDQETANGTMVNDAKIVRPTRLYSGDIVQMGEVRFIVRTNDPSPAARIVSADVFRRLLDDEIEKANDAGRSAGLVAISMGGDDASRVTDAIATHARRFERISVVSPDLMLLLLPEGDGNRAREVARRLASTLGRPTGSPGIGFALYPDDASDPRSLERAAVRAISPHSASELGAPLDPLVTDDRILRVGSYEAVVSDPAMREVVRLVSRLSASELPILIYGETGTGKEIVAHLIHERSSRRDKPFVPVNCAAIPESLAESEFFGHQRGAFTGAVTAKVGYLAAADGGTLFLDEIGELPLAIQAKLLRALESKRFTPVGETRERAFDARIVTATHRDLAAEIAAKRFREDLFYRIAGGTVWLPPLRERPSDFPLLVRRFIDAARTRFGRPPVAISPGAMQRLFEHEWPGNVRELRNTCEYLAASEEGASVSLLAVERRLGAGGRVRALGSTAPLEAVLDIPPTNTLNPNRTFRPIDEELEEIERARMLSALEATGYNQTKAADLIAMPRRTFVKKIVRYGLGR